MVLLLKGLHDLKDSVVTRTDIGIQFNYLIPSTGKNITNIS